MSDFLNYVDRGYKFDNSEGHPKEKTLVVDGCSMVGSWSGPRYDIETYEPIQGVEGGDIGINFSERWDFNCLSLNMPAKSNCSIFRDTTNFLLYNYKKLNLSYENLFLIIEWSGLARYSYFNRLIFFRSFTGL